MNDLEKVGRSFDERIRKGIRSSRFGSLKPIRIEVGLGEALALAHYCATFAIYTVIDVEVVPGIIECRNECVVPGDPPSLPTRLNGLPVETYDENSRLVLVTESTVPGCVRRVNL